ncbi:retrovirus-related pol polyprotein from transposon TNT 1-94 [Tanacetum coccineum]
MDVKQEVLPEDMEAQAKTELNKKAHSAVILCLGNKVLREVTGETTAAGVWSKLKTLYMTKSLANKLYLKKKLYTLFMLAGRKISEHIDEFNKIVLDLANIEILGIHVVKGKSMIEVSKVEGYQCDICQSEDHMKRNCPKNNLKKSIGYVKKDEQTSSSGSTYDDSDVMMVMSTQAQVLLDLIMDSGCSNHMTPRLDILFDFLECDGGSVQLGDNRECKNTENWTYEQRGTTVTGKRQGCLDKKRVAYQGVIDYVHSDLWGPSQVESLGGKRYFLSIVDDYSRRFCNWEVGRNYALRVGMLDIMTVDGRHASDGGSRMYEHNFLWIRRMLRGNCRAEEEDTHEPLTYQEVVAYEDSSKWKAAIKEEMDSLRKNKTWELVDHPAGQKLVSCKWQFKIKEGIEVRHTSIRVILALTACKDYKLEQLDVKTVFLHGNLEEVIYIKQSLGYEQANKVCLLKKSLYGLKKSPRQWYRRFDEYMLSNGFKRSNDMLISCKSKAEIGYTKSLLKKEFDMKELGEAKKIIGMEIVRDRSRKILSVSQSGYVSKILNNFRIDNGKSVKMPLGRHFKLSLKDYPVKDCDVERMSKVPYVNAVGSLMYLMVCTRPDIAYVCFGVSRYFGESGKNHGKASESGFLKYLRAPNTTPKLSGYKCLLCKRDLALTSEGAVFQPAIPPPVAVLPCGHIFHDQCLENITPEDQAKDPPCIPCAIGEN